MIPLRDDIPSRTTPFVAWTFLAVNVAVFLWQVTSLGDSTVVVDVDGHRLALASGFEQSVWRFGLRPVELVGGARLPPYTPVPEWTTILTSMFMHGGWAHLLGNMLYLWIFADNVEDRMGHGRFVAFYLLSGLAAAGAQIASEPHANIPMVGASGAIAGVLGAYLVLYPHARVLTLVPIFYYVRIVHVPALVLLGFWFLMQILSASASSGATGGVAFLAHIGGFVFGLAGAKLFARRSFRVGR
jgi:membrane associated rhomboid family serine protease